MEATTTINIFGDDKPVQVTTGSLRALAWSVEIWAMVMESGTPKGRRETAAAMREYVEQLRREMELRSLYPREISPRLTSRSPRLAIGHRHRDA